MKSNIDNIQTIHAEIPNFYKGTFNYNLLTEKHFEDGWREVVLPSFDITTQKLSDAYILENDIVTKEVIDLSEEELAEINKVVVPQSVTNAQFRLALIDSGISISNINSYINGIEDETQKETIQSLWEYANYFERANQQLGAMAQLLGLSSEQLDNLFILANTK